jgi:hypothetical protein
MEGRKYFTENRFLDTSIKFFFILSCFFIWLYYIAAVGEIATVGGGLCCSAFMNINNDTVHKAIIEALNDICTFCVTASMLKKGLEIIFNIRFPIIGYISAVAYALALFAPLLYIFTPLPTSSPTFRLIIAALLIIFTIINLIIIPILDMKVIVTYVKQKTRNLPEKSLDAPLEKP